MTLDPQLVAFLREPHVAVLATRFPSGGLQATPVWYLYEDGHFLVNTRRDRAKLRNMQRDPRVALVILDRQDPYRYVHVQGRAVRFDPESGARDIDRLSVRYLGRPWVYPPEDGPELRVSVWVAPQRVHAFGL